MNGVVNILKPPGMMSNGVVVFLRRILNIKKVGHTGTLDPGAAGVLPVCIGKSTRLSDYIMGHDKVYVAEITFGAVTDTLDAYGKLIKEQPSNVSESMLVDAMASFVGTISQIPPMYSAIKIGGKKLYELARAGKTVEIQPREVTVYNIELISKTGPQSWLMRVYCSKGTYVRTLLADIAASMGELAYTSFLMREASGGFCVQNAYTLDEISKMAENGDYSFIIPPDAVLCELPSKKLSEKQARLLLNGVPIDCDITCDTRVYAQDAFLGIAAPTEKGVKLKLFLGEAL